MERLATQLEQYQQQVFRNRIKTPLLLLTSMILQRYLCLIVLVVIVPLSSLYYVTPTLLRLLYRMVFRERFALFRAGRVDVHT